MGLVSKKNDWSNEIGKTVRCESTGGKNLTVDNFYKILDHLWDKDGSFDHYVVIEDDSGNKITAPMENFHFSIDY